jgi:hypothetical protein
VVWCAWAFVVACWVGERVFRTLSDAPVWGCVDASDVGIRWDRVAEGVGVVVMAGGVWDSCLGSSLAAREG